MQDREKLLKKIIGLLLRGEWVNLYGPDGIGKESIVRNIHKFITKEHTITHLSLIIKLDKIKAFSVETVEDEVLKLIALETKIDLPDEVDFFERMTNILKKIQKQLILLLTSIDVVSYEGALHIAKELSKLYHLKENKKSPNLTVLVCGGVQLKTLSYEKTSPFHHARPIHLEEINEEEAKELIYGVNNKISEGVVKILYKETGGYPLLLKELVKEITDDLLKTGEENLITDRLITRLIDENDLIKSPLINSWFYKINRPEFLFVLQKLLNNEQVKISESKLPVDKIEFSGLFKVDGKYVNFRNSFIKKFSERYGTKKRIADHYWIFSSQDDSCWKEGCHIYNSIPEKERERVPEKVVGPMHKRLSDLITSGGTLMAKTESEVEVLEIMDNILQYLFNIRSYFVAKKNENSDQYKIYFAPIAEEFPVGKIIEDPEIMDLLGRCYKENRDWVHSWNHGFMAFPLIRDPQKHMVLWIDNRSGVVTKYHNRNIALLASLTGMAIMHLEKRETLQDDLNLLKKVLEHDEDYVQFVDMNRKIKMMNKRAEEDARKRFPNKESFIGEECRELFLKGECSGQCACNQVFKDGKKHRRPETWSNSVDKKDTRYMDVIAVPLKKDNRMVGVFQIARDLTLLRRAMEAMIDISSAKTEEEVFSLLLKFVIRMGVKRVRLYLPSENWEKDPGVAGELISKECMGYEDDPNFEIKFRSGNIKLDGDIERYWYEPQKVKKKPIISRIRRGIDAPKIAMENKSVLIYNVPPQYDTCRKEVKKEKVEEWICIGLFAGGKFFGAISVDKGSESEIGSFRIIECDRMISICRAAALALHRISVPNIQKVVRVFRHSIAQQLDAINHFIWTFAESDLPKEKRETYARIVDKELKRFDYFSRSMAALLPEMGKPRIFPKKLNVKKLFKGIEDLFHYYFEKVGIIFDTSACSSTLLSSINTDEMVVRTILTNLLNNSIKSLEKWYGEKRIIIKCRRGFKSLIISVIDTGPGVTKKDQPRMFDPGYSGKEGQTGIGLPASKFLAEWIKATITFDEKYKNGAKFDLKLPDLS